ncbi:MAG TPA: TolC family outer membrane protein [Alphaproteobacteria bacterium]|nr:TolC family outer membrane protein [Alphaproteobacteria bacterium]
MKSLLPIGISALVVSTLGAGPARAQSLTDALALAYQSNPTLAAERAALRGQDEGVAQALSGWRPTVTVSGNGGREWLNQVPRSSGEPATTYWTRTGAITVKQNLYTGGRIGAQTEAADDAVFAERAHLQSVEGTVLDEAAGAYVDVVQDEAVLALNDNNVQVLEKQLEATQDEFKAGTVTRTDVSQAEAAVSSAKAGREAAANQLNIARAAYFNVIGAQPGQLTDPGEPAGLPGTEAESITLAQHQNPDVVNADFNERQAVQTVKVQFSGFLPQIYLQGLAQKGEDLSTPDDFTETSEILAVLSMPIYTGGLVESEVRQAKDAVSQRRLQLDQARRTAIQNATIAWQTLQSARAQLASYGDQIKADEVALDGTEQEQRAGLRTVLDILNAQQALLTARVDYTQSHHDEIRAGYDLLAAIGKLTARDRKLPVEYFDPSVHYKDVRDRWFDFGQLIGTDSESGATGGSKPAQ